MYLSFSVALIIVSVIGKTLSAKFFAYQYQINAMSRYRYMYLIRCILLNYSVAIIAVSNFCSTVTVINLHLQIHGIFETVY